MIDKALEKDTDLRYQSAAEMRADLKRLKRDSDASRGSGTHAQSWRRIDRTLASQTVCAGRARRPRIFPVAACWWTTPDSTKRAPD